MSFFVFTMKMLLALLILTVNVLSHTEKDFRIEEVRAQSQRYQDLFNANEIDQLFSEIYDTKFILDINQHQIYQKDEAMRAIRQLRSTVDKITVEPIIIEPYQKRDRGLYARELGDITMFKADGTSKKMYYQREWIKTPSGYKLKMDMLEDQQSQLYRNVALKVMKQ